MPKNEPMTPKAIANRIKAKGLQKLRWYCQMCNKQCRDQNGFKCHLMSESHQRQLLLFADNPGSYLNEFSVEFERGFMDIVRRQYGTKRVHANMIYQQYIKDRNHIHMNSTSWYTLTGFVQYLSRKGICKVDHTEKGWFIQYIDHEEEERREKLVKKQKMDKDDDERIQEMVMRQAEKAREQLGEEKLDDASSKGTELLKTDEQKIEFQLPKNTINQDKQPVFKKPKTDFLLFEEVDEAALSTSSKSRKSEREKSEKPSKSTSALDEIRAMEEMRKEAMNRKDYWLHEDLVVKIVTKRLGEKYYKQKGRIEEVQDKYTGLVRILNSDGKANGDILKLDQTHVETVIPAVGNRLLIVNGAYRGAKAVLKKVDVDNFCVTVCIDEGPTKGRVVEKVQYEDVCKVYEN